MKTTDNNNKNNVNNQNSVNNREVSTTGKGRAANTIDEVKAQNATTLLLLAAMKPFRESFRPVPTGAEGERRSTVSTDRVAEILGGIDGFTLHDVACAMLAHGYETAYYAPTEEVAWVYYTTEEEDLSE